MIYNINFIPTLKTSPDNPKLMGGEPDEYSKNKNCIYDMLHGPQFAMLVIWLVI
jgi:hypothetical protein